MYFLDTELSHENNYVNCPPPPLAGRCRFCHGVVCLSAGLSINWATQLFSTAYIDRDM